MKNPGIINSAKSIEELRNIINGMSHDERDLVDFASLPTFGGKEPKKTRDVYSWDETRILVRDDDGWKLEPRCKECGEAPFHCHHDRD